MSQPLCIVTGATSGFGEAIARLLASHSWRLVITGRRGDRLEALASELNTISGAEVMPLVFDVRDYSAVKKAWESLPTSWQEPDALINNAGLALGRNSTDEGDPDDWNAMIDTNIKGLLYVTRVISPGMVKRRKGTIINIGSIAGKETYPGGNVYSATKFAVDALTKSMRLDFVHAGIRVSQISPGAAETEFSLVRFKGDADKAHMVYQGFVPLNASDIAEAAMFILSRPERVSVNDLVIMPTAQASSTLFHRSQP